MEKELQEYLDSLAQPPQEDGLSSFAKYRVVRLLGFSEFEETQLVYRIKPSASDSSVVNSDANSEGPFVRKIIDAQASGGQVYEMLFDAQKSGIEFKHIPEIIECGYEGDSLIVVTEYVEGSSLEATVNAFGPSEQLACRVFLSLCDAVIELHELMEKPVVHRDLKPSNIMLSNGEAVLIDFGISRVFKEGACRDTRQFGTRSYAPPEQFGFGQTSVRSDVYALGMVLYFCLTGKQPSSTLADDGRPDSISPELWNVILVATQFDPNARFADVRALRSAAKWAFSRRLQEGERGASSGAAFDDAGFSLGTDDDSSVSAGEGDEAVPVGAPSSWSLGSRPAEAPDRQPLKGPWSVATSGGRALSWLWNGLLVGVSLLLWLGLVESVVQPSQPETVQDTVIRFFEGVGLLVLPVNLLAYGLADLRRHERFPLAERSWLSRLGLMAKTSAVVFFASFFVVGLFFPA